MRDPRARKNPKFQSARAWERVLLVFFERAGGQAPQLWEAWPSARARARALSTTQNCKITTFLLVNFENDQGKSCSVSRDWQPPKISAQSLRLFKLELLELLSSNPNFRDFPKSWKKVPIFLSPAAAKPRVGWKVPICWRISSRARAAHGGEKSSYSELVDLKAANSGQLYFILLVNTY